MIKKFLIISSDYDNFFFKPIIFQLKKKIKNLDVCIVEEKNKLKVKRYIYILSMFNVFELIDLLFTIIKFKFHKKKYDYSYKKIYDLNNPNFINYIKTKKFHLVSLFNCPQIIKKNTLHKLNTNIANFHPAILSNHRGLFPIFYAILNRNKHIGISFHKVREKIDYGELISELKIPINKKYGFFYMYKKLYFNNESFKFIKNSILNYKSIKIKKLNKKKLSKYYSYPSLMQIVKFKFIRIFN